MDDQYITEKRKKSDRDELRSGLSELVMYQPPWIIRWGMAFIISVFVLVFFLSSLVEYPDIVEAPFRLMTYHSPKPVVAKIHGRLVKILVKDQETVLAGQALAYLESTANPNQILALSSWVDTLMKSLDNTMRTDIPALPTLHHLGEIQTAYQSFEQIYRNSSLFGPNGYYAKRKQNLQNELADLMSLESSLAKQQEIHQKDLIISQEEYQLQKKLKEQQVISSLDLKKEVSKLLAKQIPLQQSQAALFHNRSLRRVKERDLMDLDRMFEEQNTVFRQSLMTLQSTIDAWKSQYMMVAHASGRIHYSHFLEENQIVNAQQPVFYVVSDSRKWYGEITLQQPNMGRIKVGQTVYIQFASYPAAEFGSVKGNVAFLSALPNGENEFLGKIELPDGLITQYQKKISYKSGMVAKAQIVTQNSSLLKRMLYRWRGMANRL